MFHRVSDEHTLLVSVLCRWGVATLDEQLAEPTQLCRLLLSGKVSNTLDGVALESF